MSSSQLDNIGPYTTERLVIPGASPRNPLDPTTFKPIHQQKPPSTPKAKPPQLSQSPLLPTNLSTGKKYDECTEKKYDECKPTSAEINRMNRKKNAFMNRIRKRTKKIEADMKQACESEEDSDQSYSSGLPGDDSSYSDPDKKQTTTDLKGTKTLFEHWSPLKKANSAFVAARQKKYKQRSQIMADRRRSKEANNNNNNETDNNTNNQTKSNSKENKKKKPSTKKPRNTKK